MEAIFSPVKTPAEIISFFSGIFKDRLSGILLFGSCAKLYAMHGAGDSMCEAVQPRDVDIGVIADQELSGQLNFPSHWDVFIWSERRWEKGFPLQISLAEKSVILYERNSILSGRLRYLKTEVMPALYAALKSYCATEDYEIYRTKI